MRVRTALLVGAFAVALFALPAGGALSAEGSQTYIVQMLEDPAVAYDGGVAGLAATKPGKGKKIDPESGAVKNYVNYLKGKHDQALEKVGGAPKVYDYGISYNGFAAKLTESQAQALMSLKGVVAVTKDELLTADTSSTPTFLGLTAAGGLWQQLGGKADGSAGGKNAAGPGEDVVIGVIDSGIWPESKSFSDRDAAGELVYQNMPGRNFTCQNGEAFDNELCNKKLIGAKFFNAAWGGSAALEAQRPWEYMSPRDYNGHGTHTAGTAGGNNGVPATGAAAGFGKVSGMAPRARIAAYKALWSTQDGATASGFGSDLVAAIDTAVADGVDVINYSISGTSTNFLDGAEVAFLFAADAGVFVSASAGNSGPTTGTVAHPSPWITTVAAGTHNRSGSATVTLGNAAVYNGASVTPGVGPAPLVHSINVGLAGAAADRVRQCFSGPYLDPAKVAGKIVLCERGGSADANARVDKSAAVEAAGGVGTIVGNVAAGASVNADFHSIPTVHVDNVAFSAIASYISSAGTGATARLSPATITSDTPAPFTAGFSSRGPLTAGGGDLLKPDVIAPGQDILAAVAKTPAQGNRDFNLLSGTSMSAPHVAGLAALLKDKFPTWSPMAIKSALMTSGSDVLDGPNTNPLVIFRQGAGHVRPNVAANPGLVFDSGFNEWLAFLCGTTTGVNPATCTALQGAGFSTDASDFNTASIAIGDMAGVQTVTRKVTNVGGSAATYTPSFTGMSGFNVQILPASLNLAAGQTGTFTVKFTTTTATLNAYTGGQLSWSDGSHIVRIPMVVRPVALAAPRQVSGTGGPINYNVTFGYTGSFSATPRGLVPAATVAGTVADDPTDGACTLAAGPDKDQIPVVVPAGSTYARFSLFDDFTDGNDDIDLCVFNAGGTLVGTSTSGTSAEEVNLVNPAAGTYTAVVHGWGTDGPDANYTFFNWVLGTADVGNMTVTAPGSAVIGTTGAINLTFPGPFAAATKYLGSVAYAGSPNMPNPTIVRVDTP